MGSGSQWRLNYLILSHETGPQMSPGAGDSPPQLTHVVEGGLWFLTRCWLEPPAFLHSLSIGSSSVLNTLPVPWVSPPRVSDLLKRNHCMQTMALGNPL